MDLNEGKISQVLHFIMSCIVRRLHYKDAARMIDQVPAHLRDPLLDLPAGPDRSITVFGILDGVIKGFGMTEPQAQMVLSRFWTTLGGWLEPETYDEVRGIVFNEPPKKEMKKVA